MTPVDWRRVRIREIADVRTGSTPPTRVPGNYDGDYLFVSPADLGEHRYVTCTGKTLSKQGFEQARAVPQGSVLFTCIGSTIGKAGIAGRDLATNQQINSVTCHKDKALDEYVYYALTHSADRIRLLAGTQAVPIVNKSVFENWQLSLPPLPEQRKIAEILTTWDDALALLDRRIELARKRKKGLMQRLLTGRVRFPEFEGEEWGETRLDKVVERITRKNNEGCQNVLTMSAQRGLISQTEYYNKRIAAKDVSHYYLLRRGEFAYNKSTSNGYPFGAIKRLDDYDEGVLSTLYICFRLKDRNRVHSDFVAHYFEGGLLNKGIYSIAQEGARNHGLLNISLADFFGLRLWLPSLPEQRRIAELLQTCDEEIALLRRKRELTAQQKKGLMQRLLTGRVRVSE